MAQISSSRIMSALQTSLKGILRHYTVAGFDAVECDPAVLDSMITIKSASDDITELMHCFENAKHTSQDRESEEDRAGKRNIYADIGKSLLDLASYVEHLERLLGLASTKQWEEVHRAFDALYPSKRYARKPHESLGDRMERMDLPGVSDLETSADVVSAISRSLDWLTSFGTILQIYSDFDEQDAPLDASAAQDRETDDLERRLADLFDASETCDLQRDSNPRSSFDDIATPRRSHESFIDEEAKAEPVPQFVKINRKYLEIESLQCFDIAWEFDSEDEDFLVLRDPGQSEIDRLFDHTKQIRQNRLRPQKRLEQAKRPEFAFIRRRSEMEAERRRQQSYAADVDENERDRSPELERDRSASTGPKQRLSRSDRQQLYYA